MLINVCLPDSIFLNQGVGQIITFAFGLAFNILTVFWCFYDSAERGERLSSAMFFLIIIFGIFAALFYLFRSRGFKSGLIAVGKLILLFIGIIVVATVFQVIRKFI